MEKAMSAEQRLEKYISQHPDYWDFEEEVKEVERLKAMCGNQPVANHDLQFCF